MPPAPGPTPRVRFSMRWMMVGVAVIALPLGCLASFLRDFERAFPSTPAGWARKWAAYHEAELKQKDGLGFVTPGFDERSAKRYRELAKGFEAVGATFEEGTLCGPFTDQLTRGEKFITQLAYRASSSEGRVDGPIPPGTACVVVWDGAFDTDSCSDDRPIEVNILDGPHAGKLALIERIYLRRRP